MGLSRYRGSSRSFVRDRGNVRRAASRVSGRAVEGAFVASAAAVRAARRERSHRDHNESSGGGGVAVVLASRRAIGGTACSARCDAPDGRSATTAGPTAPGRSVARQAVGSGGPEGRQAGGRQGLVGGLHGGQMPLPGDVRQSLQQPEQDQGQLIVDAERHRLARHADAGEPQTELLGPAQGSAPACCCATARRPRPGREAARGRSAECGPRRSARSGRRHDGPGRRSRARRRVASTLRGTGRWVQSHRHEPSGSCAGDGSVGCPCRPKATRPVLLLSWPR
jgi:hypothetical protein